MADYRTPLPGLLAGALEAGVNRALAMDERSVERLERIEGKVLRLDLDGLAITLYFAFDCGAVEVSLDGPESPDARITGTPPALFSLASDGNDWGTPGSGVRIEGDASLARDLGKVFGQLDPDWQAPLDELLGDTLGYQVSQGLRRGAKGLRGALEQALGMAGHYLHEESGAIIGARDIEAFSAAVDDLRDGVDRLEARIGRAERRRRSGGEP